MNQIYLFTSMLLFALLSITEAKSQDIVKWEKEKENNQQILVAPLNEGFKLSFEIGNNKSFNIVFSGSDNSKTKDLLTMAFKHFELNLNSRAFGISHAVPYIVGDRVEVLSDSGLLQIIINDQKIFTAQASESTPKKMIYKSTESESFPPHINIAQ